MRKRLEETWPASKVELWPLDKIIPYEKNPRLHPESQIELIAISMKEDGVTAPILVDEDGIIIYGHGRRLAALKNGFLRYPVAVAVGWSEQEKQSVRIKDNSIGEMSTWGAALIKSEIGNLKLSGYDVQLLGFPESQLRGWGISAGTDSGQDPEATPERPKKPVVRKGDLWVLGDHRIICGDATSKSDVAACLGGAKPHLMVTDPPYGVSYDPAWRDGAVKVEFAAKRATGKVQNDESADWRGAWSLFPGDVAYIWHASMLGGVVAAGLQEAGFDLRSQIIWVKQHFILGRGDYHWQHETCWYAVRKGRNGHWGGDRSQSTCWEIKAQIGYESIRKDNVDKATGHGTQKPIECMKRPIENNSRKGDHVYDPFVGSGTTIIACEMTGRKCLAIEIDPGYVQVGIERWEKFTGRKALLDGRTLEQVAKARRTGRPKGETDAPVGNAVRRLPERVSGRLPRSG